MYLYIYSVRVCEKVGPYGTEVVIGTYNCLCVLVCVSVRMYMRMYVCIHTYMCCMRVYRIVGPYGTEVVYICVCVYIHLYDIMCICDLVRTLT